MANARPPRPGALLALIALLVAAPLLAQAQLKPFFGSNDQDLLPVDQAFPFSAELVAPDRVVARWNTREGYYLYRDKITFELKGGDNAVARVERPPGETKDDPYFGKLQVYHDPVRVAVYLEHAAGNNVTLVAHYQGCADAGLCYPPQTVDYPLAGGGATTSTASSSAAGTAGALRAGTDRLTGILREGRPLPILAAFFAAGLLLAFTACLYPMVPILSGLIAGDRHRRKGKRAFLLSLVYVEATALTYAIAGTIAGVSGQAVQANLQSPWVLGGFAAVFVVLALSMFGLYELQLPSAWQTRISEASRHQKGGSVVGVAVMGMLSALIVGACSGPALIAALVFISATGNAWLGGLALFVLANGMGVPLLLIGTAAGKWLPHSGHWMETVRRVFGVVFLAVALWMADRVIPPALSLALWGVLLLGCGVFLGGLDHLATDARGFQRLRKAGGLVLLLWGGVALIGAAAGGTDVLQPLRGLMVAGTPAAGQVADESAFRKVRSLSELRGALREASAAGRPALLDVYADWCVYCVQLDKEVFSNPGVRNLLSGAVLLRADVTAMNEADKRLMKGLNVFLPPAVMFFGPDGNERRSLRVVGSIGPDDFMTRARSGLFGGTSG